MAAMTDDRDPQPTTFAYEAESADGQPFRGTLDAAALPAAAEQLRSLHLRVTRLEPAGPPRGRLNDGDLLRVNQQLSHLADGGMPLERGLRLIADELPRRQAEAVRAIAADLEAGVPVADALTRRSAAFPPDYADLLAAGVAGNNLGGVLVNLGRHVELTQRLRAAVWRAAVYPLTVAVALLLTLAFIWGKLMPGLDRLNRGSPLGRRRVSVYSSRNGAEPPSLDWLPEVARWVSYGVMAALVVTVGLAILMVVNRRWAGRVGRRLPVVGPVVRGNDIARWCDGLNLGVSAGLDLPAALTLAGRGSGSTAGRADAETLAGEARAGRRVDLGGPLRLLPPTVPASLAIGVDRHDLPDTAATLARLYREQAEARLAAVPAVLSPVLLLVTAVAVGLSLAAALLPLIVAIRSFSNA